MVNLIFFAKELIWIWTGEIELSEQASIYLPFIAISYSMGAIGTTPYNIAIANGYTKLNNVLGMVSLAITIPGYWLVVKYYGALGVAYLYCVVQILTMLILVYIVNKKFIKIKNPISLLYIKQMLLPLIISLLIASIFSIKSSLAFENRFYTFIWIMLSVFTTFLFNLILIPFKDLKRILRFRKT